MSLADELFYGGGAGGGKALDIETLIMTSGGFVRMGDLCVGHTVFDAAGMPCQVVACSPVMLDHQCYKVAFDDGDPIIADAEHRWVTCAAGLKGIRTTAEIAETIGLGHTIAGGSATWMRRRIVACMPTASVPVRCIAVDSPTRLYLAGRHMVPTHNTDLLLGAALVAHTKSIIFRREYKQLEGLRERSSELWGHIGRWNGQKELWRVQYGGAMKRIEFGAVQLENDKLKWQGRDHDLKGFDEITHFSHSQYRFLTGWNRTANPNQRTRIICAGNPPTDAEGDWVITHWAPWLDPTHPNPAKDGELRWFAVIKGEDVEVAGPEPIIVEGESAPVHPKSRTFIRALYADNPWYVASGYVKTLQAMPEPLRSQMLLGDFGAGRKDNDRQVIPTEWVLLAQSRWRDQPPGPMDALGVDVARGGADKTVLTPRHRTWFGKQSVYPGTSTPDGWAALQLIMQALPPNTRPMVNIDIIGVGAAVFDLCIGQGLNAHALDARHGTNARDEANVLSFANKRAQWWWQMREALDPLHGSDLALPPDRELLADLTSARWEPRTNGILIEPKDDIIERIGRSPDKGESLILAHAMPTRLPQTRLI